MFGELHQKICVFEYAKVCRNDEKNKRKGKEVKFEQCFVNVGVSEPK